MELGWNEGRVRLLRRRRRSKQPQPTPRRLLLQRTEPRLLLLLAGQWTITDPRTRLRRHARSTLLMLPSTLLLLPATTTAAALLGVAVRHVAATAVGTAMAALSLCCTKARRGRATSRAAGRGARGVKGSLSGNLAFIS